MHLAKSINACISPPLRSRARHAPHGIAFTNGGNRAGVPLSGRTERNEQGRIAVLYRLRDRLPVFRSPPFGVIRPALYAAEGGPFSEWGNKGTLRAICRELQWATASMYLLGATIVMALLAALAGFTDFLGDQRIRAFQVTSILFPLFTQTGR